MDLDHERIMRRTAEIIGKTDANFCGVFSVAYGNCGEQGLDSPCSRDETGLNSHYSFLWLRSPQAIPRDVEIAEERNHERMLDTVFVGRPA